ncbi:MAG TPA: pitrilysin family protein [Thermoanaerobaculia bacterium]|nr:pitrilysin family protein [Thermoanaerobaculia bacterium]
MTLAAQAAESELRRTVLPNGLTVLSELMPGVRSVALGTWVRAASLHESPEKMGVSHMLEHMVFKGTQTRSAKELALALEVLGGSLDAYTAREHTSYQAKVLDEHLPQAADVLADLVFRPVLRASDLTLERKVVLEEISTVDDTPDDLVFELHNAQLWGAHPYGYSILGTRETVGGLEQNDLRALHSRAYHPEQIVVAAAGNVEHDALLDTLESTAWSKIPRGGPPALTSPAPIVQPPSAMHFERDTAQTHIVIGAMAFAHNDPRRYAMSMIGMLFGGGMSSRLFQRVREELGLAYSVYSFQSFHEDAGMHGVYVGTTPETARAAVDVINDEMEKLASNGLSEEDMTAGKSQLKGQITLSLESPTSRMYRAAGVELYGEPYRTLDEVLALVDAIDTETVAAICKTYYAPGRQTLVSLGPKAAA